GRGPGRPRRTGWSGRRPRWTGRRAPWRRGWRRWRELNARLRVKDAAAPTVGAAAFLFRSGGHMTEFRNVRSEAPDGGGGVAKAPLFRSPRLMLGLNRLDQGAEQ